MTYTKKKCPHCGQTLSFTSFKSNLYGSPIRNCSFCFETYIDKDFIEIAVSGIEPIDKKRVSLQTILLSIVGVFFFVGSLITENLFFILFGLIALGFSIWFIVDEYRGYDERQVYLKAETINSEKRLSNPEYALALKELGYKVPQKYLPNKNQEKIGETTHKTKPLASKPETYLIGKDISAGKHIVIPTKTEGSMIHILSNDGTLIKRTCINDKKTLTFKSGTTIKLYNCKIEK